MSEIPPGGESTEASQSRWTRALGGTGEDWREAFSDLAESYWYCVYAWWRRAGLEAADAGTATLACFTRWLGETPPRASDSGAKQMREWVAARLTELGEQEVEFMEPAAITIDPDWAERRYADEPGGEREAIFERRWAISVIEFTAATLQGEYEARVEEALFGELLAFAGFGAGDEERYAAAAARTNRSSGAMRKAVFDFRTRQREILRSFVADTVLDAEDADREITALLCACDAAGAEAADAPLPSAIQTLHPDEVLARAMQSVHMSKASRRGWEPPTVEEAARLFPQYEIFSLLGRGGMGAVYKARQIELDRFVAIKLLPLEVSVDRDFAERFRREARAMAKLDHPNIISVHKFGTTSEGHLFFAMEFVEGANLHQMIRGAGLAPLQALGIIGGVCDALAYAHEKGVVHRDIKPANVMVSVEGSVKVADFGLARLTDAAAEQLGHTVTGTVMGTADYMAPEQTQGSNVDHRADIYSIGVMLYEMLCREVPRGVFDPPSTRIAGINTRVDDVVIKAMAQQPERRYQTTKEMKSEVAAATSILLAKPGRPGTAPPRPGSLPAPGAKKSRAPLFIGVAAVLAGLAAAAIFLTKPKPPPTPPLGAKNSESAKDRQPASAGTAKSTTEADKDAAPAPSGLPSPPVATPSTVAAAPNPEPAELKPPAAPPPRTLVASAMAPQPSSLSVTGKWIAEQEPQWQMAFANEVRTPFEKSADDLKRRYLASLTVQLATATRDHQREAAGVVRAEQKLLGDGGDVPDVEEAADPPALKAVRSAYRKSFAALDAERLARAKPILARIDAILAPNQAALTQRGRLDEALEIKAKREELAAVWLRAPTSLAMATKDRPFVNTLGMKFAPVPILGGPTGGQQVLFSIWDTRVQDYEVFAKETSREWPKPDFEQGPTHPAVNVSWEDAQAFCQWLSAREQAAGRLPSDWRYRLPSDYEWSCAVGIGEKEDAAKRPSEKDMKTDAAFPWGTEWPPPSGAGNYAGEEARTAMAAGKYPSLNGVIAGYNDGFVNTSPVGSFKANQFGLFDMGGNVWQWCEDWYDTGESKSVRRGASWDNNQRDQMLSSVHNRHFPGARVDRDGYRVDRDGFRCVVGAAGAQAVPGSSPSPVSTPPPAGIATKDRPLADLTAAPAAAEAAGPWEDLLRQLTPKIVEQTGHGWKKIGSMLHSPAAGAAILPLPGVFTGASYQVHLKVREETANEVFVVSLPVGDHLAVFALDGWGTPVTSFLDVDGKNGTDVPGALVGRQVKDSTLHNLELTVRLNGPNATIATTLDKRLLVEWTGPMTSLGGGGSYWPVPPGTLAIGTNSESWTVSEVKVKRLENREAHNDPDANRLPEPKIDATGWADLLAPLTPAVVEQRGNGWRMKDGAVYSPDARFATLRLPGAFSNTSYQLRVKMRQLQAKDIFLITLPVGRRAVGFYVDGNPGEGSDTALDAVNGEYGRRLPSAVLGKQVKDSEWHDLEVTVRLDGENAEIASTLDKRPLYKWAGPIATLSLFGAWAKNAPNSFALGAVADDWVVSEVKVKRLEPK